MSDDLRPGSFKGVAFEVKGAAPRELGRNVYVHSYPYRGSQGEDMGPRDQILAVQALILGPNYMPKRDAFEAALNSAGPGILIHPWIGQVRARLIEARVTESTEEGGLAVYELTFLPEPVTPSQTSAIDTTAVAEQAAGDLVETATADFGERFDVSDQPEFVLDEAMAVIADLSDQFDAVTAPLSGAGETLSRYIQAGQALRQDVLNLAAEPLKLASQISGLITGVRQLAGTPADGLNILSGFFAFGSSLKPVSRSTPPRSAQADNQDALVDFVRARAAAEAVLAASQIDFAAYQDAVAVRDALAEQLDDIAIAAADTGRDDVWRTLGAARVAIIRDITRRGADLARLYTLTPPATVPALVLAYRLYDDVQDLADRAAEIVARNRIRHPGFVPGGQALELLTDV